ncbi:hypothetical protein Bca4012_084865 [Brassica carinata]|uniref:Uncharacterized protein n=1 Tax=Brassica carinata TaxID=52824 RepID=A0A8X7SGH5_BRACI|nr:hypothetical protein Bca52824_025789 [Brassica carinata]
MDFLLMRSKRGQPHHSRIVITQLPPEIGDQVRNQRRRLPVEPVESHDRLLPHGFLLVAKQVHHLRQNRRDRRLPIPKRIPSNSEEEAMDDDDAAVRRKRLRSGNNREEGDETVRGGRWKRRRWKGRRR